MHMINIGVDVHTIDTIFWMFIWWLVAREVLPWLLSLIMSRRG